MPQKLLDVLLLGLVSTNSPWPRRAADGQFYELFCSVPLNTNTTGPPCGAPSASSRKQARAVASPKRRQHVRKPTWVPRARRIKMDAVVRYRVKNLGSWTEGIIENLSQSGVLLKGAQRFPENTLVEMVFEMPEEISGQKNSKVLCQGRVIRMKDPREEGA